MLLMPAQLATTSRLQARGLADALDRQRPCPWAFSCCRHRVTESGLRCCLLSPRHPALPGCVEDSETVLPAPLLSRGLAPSATPHIRIQLAEYKSKLPRLQQEPVNPIRVSAATEQVLLLGRVHLSHVLLPPQWSERLAFVLPDVCFPLWVFSSRSRLPEADGPLGGVAKYPFGPRFPHETLKAAHQSSNPGGCPQQASSTAGWHPRAWTQPPTPASAVCE